jgi:hypothetical protein
MTGCGQESRLLFVCAEEVLCSDKIAYSRAYVPKPCMQRAQETTRREMARAREPLQLSTLSITFYSAFQPRVFVAGSVATTSLLLLSSGQAAVRFGI